MNDVNWLMASCGTGLIGMAAGVGLLALFFRPGPPDHTIVVVPATPPSTGCGTLLFVLVGLFCSLALLLNLVGNVLANH